VAWDDAAGRDDRLRSRLPRLSLWRRAVWLLLRTAVAVYGLWRLSDAVCSHVVRRASRGASRDCGSTAEQPRRGASRLIAACVGCATRPRSPLQVVRSSTLTRAVTASRVLQRRVSIQRMRGLNRTRGHRSENVSSVRDENVQQSHRKGPRMDSRSVGPGSGPARPGLRVRGAVAAGDRSGIWSGCGRGGCAGLGRGGGVAGPTSLLRHSARCGTTEKLLRWRGGFVRLRRLPRLARRCLSLFRQPLGSRPGSAARQFSNP